MDTLSLNRPFRQAVSPEIALFADAWLRRSYHLEILGCDLGDNGIEVTPRLLDQLWPVRELHQRVLLARFGSPVQEQTVRPLAVALLEDMGIDAELTLVRGEECGRVHGPGRGLEIEQLQTVVTPQQQIHLASQDVAIL